jgi:cytochrome c peroxidase
MRIARTMASLALAGLAAASSAASAQTSEWRWALPTGFPTPKVPTDNPMSSAKVLLGRHLFYDTRLSGNGTFSCASCHDQRRSFTDGRARAVGSTGEVHPRSSMSLANVAYSPVLTWANPLMRSLEQQAIAPMFGETPVELGLSGQEKAMLARVSAEPRYQRLFAAAFPGGGELVTLDRIVKSISAFERTLVSGRSPYDRYKAGDVRAISAAAKRGEALFFAEKTECFHCHGGFNFTGTTDYEGKGFSEIEFHNTGLYNLDKKGAYPAPNTGVHAVTDDPEDMGRFKAPSLRNVAVTAPYMHDGSIATLEGVLAHYDAGGRTITRGPHAGVGSASPLRSEFMKRIGFTTRERLDMLAFLRALTDSSFLTDTSLANPWSKR